MYTDFDPKEHKGEQLYELQTVALEDGMYATIPVPVDVSFEQATEVPWYYVVAERKGEGP